MNRICRPVAVGVMATMALVACAAEDRTDSPSTTPSASVVTEPSSTVSSSAPPSIVTEPSSTVSSSAPPSVPEPPSSTVSSSAPPSVPEPRSTTTWTVPADGVAQRISHGTNGRPVVALSFDAGSDTGFTEQILDELRAEGVRASFGMTGRWAEKNPELFRRVVGEGHHLINHTYSHESWTGVSSGRLALSRDARVEELRRADDVFVALAGASSKPWFRPPYGDVDRETEKVLGSEGYWYDAMWTVDSLGWKGLSADAIAARCDERLDAGTILLFHVGSQSQDANALPAIIAAIRNAGLQPGSVADVVG